MRTVAICRTSSVRHRGGTASGARRPHTATAADARERERDDDDDDDDDKRDDDDDDDGGGVRQDGARGAKRTGITTRRGNTHNISDDTVFVGATLECPTR